MSMGNTVGSLERLSTIQRQIVIGTLLGDGYLQKTGSIKARLRIEHSAKQSAYVQWKYSCFHEFVSRKPVFLSRANPVYGKVYRYCRFQTVASTELGEIRSHFYTAERKIIPIRINELLTDPLSLAVWYMDDGYLYRKDRNTHIYLSHYSNDEIVRLLACLRQNFGLKPAFRCKKKGRELSLFFGASETKKLMKFVSPHIIVGLDYKRLDPVTTISH